MVCKNCGEIVDSGITECPVCGEQIKESHAWKIVLLSIGAALVAFLLTFVLLLDQGINMFGWVQRAFSDEIVYTLRQDSYTVDDTESLSEVGDDVVGKIGDAKLTNAELQVYYWSGVSVFINNNQYYLSVYGLDPSQPLDQQTSPTGETWEQFFLQNAISTWHKYAALAQQAIKENFQMSDEQKQAVEEHYAQLEEMRVSGGYETLEIMLQEQLGPLCTETGYRAYVETYYLASAFFSAKYAQFAPTDAQVEAYFLSNEAELADQGITRDSKSYNVRHILIQPEGGVTDENGVTTYTDAQWEACRVKAQKMLDKWKAEDGTEDGFAQLANENSADGGSNTNGGLYSGLTSTTNFVTEFKEWYMDESRQVGDVGLVKTSYGYHIMYFSATDVLWYQECYAGALQQISEEYVENCMKDWSVKLYDRKIALGKVEMAAA